MYIFQESLHQTEGLTYFLKGRCTEVYMVLICINIPLCSLYIHIYMFLLQCALQRHKKWNDKTEMRKALRTIILKMKSQSRHYSWGVRCPHLIFFFFSLLEKEAVLCGFLIWCSVFGLVRFDFVSGFFCCCFSTHGIKLSCIPNPKEPNKRC